MQVDSKLTSSVVERQPVISTPIKKTLKNRLFWNDKERQPGEVFINFDYTREDEALKELAKKIKVPYIDLQNYTIKEEIVTLLDEQLAREFKAIPIEKNNDELRVAMADPLNLYAIEEIRLNTRCHIIPVIASSYLIETITESYYADFQMIKVAQELKEERTLKENSVYPITSNSTVNHSTIVRMVNSIIERGIKLGASDVHIEGNEDFIRIRMRVDGELQEQLSLGKASHDEVIARLKIMSGMDIAQKRLPQDGQFEMSTHSQKIGIRVSCMPTIYGEKIVLRILYNKQKISKIDDLGFTTANKNLFNQIIGNHQGIILITGPTGSGKSTTLYTILEDKNNGISNIITLEDPVEKKIAGINQTQINTDIGLTFATGLRALLRQDPDIIMLGEIRDSETAQIALRSAITGHLVFSTLHTNDASSTITRLIDMGIEPYLVASSLVGVIAQRLVRCSCTYCKEAYRSTVEEMLCLKIEEPTTLYRNRGCQMCSFTGYKGRIAIHEMIPMTAELKKMISIGIHAQDIQNYVTSHGTILLRDNMRELVLEGITTFEEYTKIIYSTD